MRDRAWLRNIVNLSARAKAEHIRREIIELQEDTVVAALEILDREPGVLLADEVGMGKTFQTLAIIACMRREKPSAKFLVVTPTRELCEQWQWTARRFGSHGFADLPDTCLGTARSLKELPEACRRKDLIFVPVDIFSGARASADRDFILKLWARHRRVPSAKMKRIRAAIAAGGLQVGEASQFLGFTVSQLQKRRLGAAFRRKRTETRGFPGLDDLLADGVEAFGQARSVRRALDRARFHTVGALLAPFDLLVVDEAHKFKDPWTVRSQAVGHVLSRNYRKAVFLTATPFQLGVDELRQVFRVFGNALDAPARFAQDVERLLASVREYQGAYERFEAIWSLADAAQSAAIRKWSQGITAAGEPPALEADVDDPNIAYLAEQAWNLLQIKRDRVEPAFRQWMLRSLKPQRRQRRAIREWELHGGQLPSQGVGAKSGASGAGAEGNGGENTDGAAQTNARGKAGEPAHGRSNAAPAPQGRVGRRRGPSSEERSCVPLVLFQRLQWEEMRAGRLTTLLPSDLSISSSYAAARQGRLLAEKQASSDEAGYRGLVNHIIATTRHAHPKVDAVTDDVLAATLGGHKTLIFCERKASIRELQERIEDGWLRMQLKEWNLVCPGYSFEQIFGGEAGDKRIRGVREQLPPRFYRGWDELSVALAESLPFALFSTDGHRPELPRSFWQATTQFVESANQHLQRCRMPIASCVRPDYALASRCIDLAVVEWYLGRGKDLSRLKTGDLALIEAIQRKGYLQEGFTQDQPKGAGRRVDRHPVQWSISRAMFDAILSPGRTGIWIYYRKKLGELTPVVRRMAVESLRYFLTRREVPFLVEVLQRAGGPNASSTNIRNAIEVWWQQETCQWRQRVAELLDYLPCLTETEQIAVLQDMMRSPRVVQNTLASGSRTLRQNTFNSPFYPMVLIGNENIQQGLDLHRQCRRVMHYDLRWNPSDLEQRIGRVERHGCLAERFDANTDEGKIEVIFPLLRQSADPAIYRAVRMRERWMDFLLGNPAAVTGPESSADRVEPLPTSLVSVLKVRLGPPSCDAAGSPRRPNAPAAAPPTPNSPPPPRRE